jgi:hypothetical protein
MFIATLATQLFLATFVEVPPSTGCYYDASNGQIVCLQPVEPTPAPEAA